jgi:hypothetical protein
VVEDNGRKRKLGQEQVFVGVDVIQGTAGCGGETAGEQWAEANRATGVRRLVKWLKELNVVGVTVPSKFM